MTKTQQHKPEIFTVFSNEIQERLDPYFYRPEFRELEEKLENSKMEIKELGEIAKIKGGKRIPLGKTFSDEKTDYPYLRVTDFNQNSVNLNNLKYISREVFDKIKNYTISTKDIYISNAGTIGLVGIIPEQLNNKSLTENAGKITGINTDKIEQKFLMYVLDSKISKKQIDRELLVVGVPKLSLERISNLRIPIPPKEIQKQIIDLMDNAYNLKKQNEEKAKKLIDGIDDFVLKKLDIKIPEIKDKMCFVVNSKEVKDNRIDAEFHQEKYKLIEKSLNNSKFEIKKLKDIITKIYYGASVKNNYEDAGGIPFLRIVNLFKNDISLKTVVRLPLSSKKEIGNAFVNEGDFLISRSGTVGIVSVIPKEAEGFAFGSFMIKFVIKDKNIDKNFVSIWLNNFVQNSLIERNKIGAIQGNITIPVIKNLQIPLPPLETQKEISKEVKSRLEKARQLKAEATQKFQNAKLEVEKILLS